VVVLETQKDYVAVLDHGPAYRLASPEVPQGPKSPTSPRKQQPQAGKGSGPGRGGKERKLTTDFREAKSEVQPSAMDIMSPDAGVTLRQGNQAKSGPAMARAKGTVSGMTRDEFERWAAQQQSQQLKEQQGRRRTSQPAGSANNGKQLESVLAKAAGGGAGAPRGGLLGSVPDATPMLSGATLRQHDVPLGETAPRGDANAVLLGGPDWGSSAAGGSFNPPPSLPFVKPSARQRELEGEGWDLVACSYSAGS
jgi:hypothetical protein